MKIKRIISCFLSIAMITSAVVCSETSAHAVAAKPASSEEISSKDISLLWEDSRVFKGTSLGSYYIMPTYEVKGYEDVPFVKASNYLDIIFSKQAHSSFEDGVLKVTKNGTEAIIDPATDTISFENTSKFRSDSIIEGAILEADEMNVVMPSLKNKSTQTKIEPLKISLADYHMPVAEYEDDILMPFLALQNTFGAITWNNLLCYNGKDYYNVHASSDYHLNNPDVPQEEMPYFNAIYSGPFSEKEAPSQDYADYSYYATCLLLDLYFGHKEEKNITTFDDYFTRINAKASLCSTDISKVSLAETLIFFYLFDSGHDAFLGGNTVFGEVDTKDKAQAGEIINDIKNSDEGKNLFEDATNTTGLDAADALDDAILGALTEKGFLLPEIIPLYAWSAYFEKVTPKDYDDERIDYCDDTAVIYFNQFKDNPARDPSFYLDPMTEDDIADNNFAFFYSCFEDIKKHKEVKNVVINLSTNGGGAASALITILGFLSKDGEVTITDMDLLSKSYREECYHVDTNLDGIADDKDGFGGEYDFYIMTSPSSYSCGNALPYFAQQNGLATIIGTKPGGGDCVVGNFMDAYGCGGAFSGMLKLGKMEKGKFVSNESVTEPDLNMMPSILDFSAVPWLDPEGITDAVHQYKDGKTEITYDDDTKIDALSEAILSIIGASGDETEEDED
ncbi:S41 family peptidase [Butyrivibrio sp. AC2005]|uniref:S41 family peptidase n=1 Tax=Butyrivibrio sp. AC2005 TaxID=1280672 RepID=UPI00040F1E3B|nr:S41 family peptidase [Butyrivibrio sp. AC2005]